MARLEDLTVGCSVLGINGDEPVNIVAVQWYGSNVIEITYKNSRGVPDVRLLYRDDEAEISVQDNHLPWSFDADGEQLRLVSEAYRISLAHLFDPYLAVHTSSVEPLPHQISAVYQEMLPKLPLRYVLADDPGAGKTIMTGLFIKELIVRGDLKRCLIVSPGSLAEQWQDELFSKFHLRFEILTNDRIESVASGNIFSEVDFCICRLDKLARNERIQEKLKVTEWDLIVCDEAHKMSATVWGGEVKYTKRFLLGRLLSNITRNFLLLTATPHNGKEEDFHLFLSLVDPDRFEGTHGNSQQAIDVSDVMRRLVKEELLKFDGTPLFPERIAYTVNYDLSPEESKLYAAVTEYVQEEFNRADKLNNERKTTVGFALTILQRRLASSPEAIYQSLRRRRERLEHRLAEERLGKRAAEYSIDFDEMDDDDLSAEETEKMEEAVVDHASAAATIAELEAEIRTLKRLEQMANRVRVSGVDRKWDELSHLLQDNEAMFGENGNREKLIIFTEHKDTLKYLAEKIRSLLGSDESVVTIHGGMIRDERRKVEELFKQDVGVRILIATDAAGEGINLQRAHLMINYDLPWNPNRLEQRFGRIHRIGQTEVCHLWNLVAQETREGFVFQRLFAKLEEERQALGGKVFDILGKVTFENKSLRELLIEAVRYGNDPKVRNRLNEVVDYSMNSKELKKLLNERALTDDVMDIGVVHAIKEDMERIEAHKLQPHFIEAFFIEAFQSVGGKIRRREKGRYEITSVPYAVRNRDMQIGFGEHVLNRYERICFDKEFRNIQGKPQAEMICPGHPLLEATIDLIRERNVDTMKRGAIFIDENDYSQDARLLFYIEDAVQDGILLKNENRRTISKHIHFVEIKEDGTASNAGYAPYLDYRAAEESETKAIRKWMQSQAWLCTGVENLAKGYAIEHLIPEHFSEVKKRKEVMLDKIAKAVKDRMTAEIQYWDYRAADLQQKEAAGKTNAKLNSKLAARRAETLEARMQVRLAEIEKERRISPMPPVITGGALIIPKGLLHQLIGTENVNTFSQGDRQSIEYAAMNAVIEIERSLGYRPKDVSAAKCGYDVESFIPESMRRRMEEYALRFIEVKGRKKGATTVTVSKNEILTALNKPEEFILAIVEVDGQNSHTIYLRHPFKNAPDFTATSVNYDIQELIQNAEILYQK
ncbi:helicase-related protein [Lachnoclostridium sp. An76]|uniref:helicase-related protein n=1 Tax=Lachnoclostridium sp. An76 TaxID=1965654 RepID=UPI000B3AA84F|nr:helicase-related protein [Lachnoclostridium sp. An76]OUN33115.1 RNA helicase [Lachnoclostridium sp. An76]